MLIQQLRQMESDGIVRRIVHHQVPPKVEYGLTDGGQALCPALDAILKWAASRDDVADANDCGPTSCASATRVNQKISSPIMVLAAP